MIATPYFQAADNATVAREDHSQHRRLHARLEASAPGQGKGRQRGSRLGSLWPIALCWCRVVPAGGTRRTTICGWQASTPT